MPLRKSPGHYEHSLCAMARLLEAVGEKHWAPWVRESIHLWQAESDTTQHLSAYGGMGSFNDVMICRANHHDVTREQEPWANTLFEWLKAVCYHLARHPKARVTEATLAKAVGRYESVLAAFVGGEKAPACMRGYAKEGCKLQGWRCLRCGHSKVSAEDLEWYIAQDVVPGMVFRACATLTLDRLVERILHSKIPGIARARKELAAAVTASGISLHKRDRLMRPCPRCGTDDTAVYRWRLVSNGRKRFEPSDDNLPLKKKRHS
jgi:hypothetical protein